MLVKGVLETSAVIGGQMACEKLCFRKLEDGLGGV